MLRNVGGHVGLTLGQSHPRCNVRHGLVGLGLVRAGLVAEAGEGRVVAHAISTGLVVGLVRQANGVVVCVVRVALLAGQATMLDDILVGALGEPSVASVVVGVALDHFLHAQGDRSLHARSVGEVPSTLDIADSTFGPAAAARRLVLDGSDCALLAPIHRGRWVRQVDWSLGQAVAVQAARGLHGVGKSDLLEVLWRKVAELVVTVDSPINSRVVLHHGLDDGIVAQESFHRLSSLFHGRIVLVLLHSPLVESLGWRFPASGESEGAHSQCDVGGSHAFQGMLLKLCLRMG
mmetsp:Transcript_20968/g.45337  ORF Transcript_20968/g.45337 Transcript_20968/m.45337 type:complete len:291 (-) Transcript_20968:11-883(-)